MDFNIVKSRHARGTREETRKRGAEERKELYRSFARSRAACFARPNRRACSQARISIAEVYERVVSAMCHFVL